VDGRKGLEAWSHVAGLWELRFSGSSKVFTVVTLKEGRGAHDHGFRPPQPSLLCDCCSFATINRGSQYHTFFTAQNFFEE